MSYKVKRGSVSTDSTMKEILVNFFKRLVALFLIVAILVVVGYVLFQYAYDRVPDFAKAADHVIDFLQGFYMKHGMGVTLGVVVLLIAAVWALIEEMDRKEKKREAMKEWLK